MLATYSFLPIIQAYAGKAGVDVETRELLAYRFAMRTSAEIGKQVHGISPAAMELLQSYPWPGNVRELQHAVERAVILSAEPVLQPHNFDPQRFGLAAGPLIRSPAMGAAAFAGAGGGGVTDEPQVMLNTLNVAEAERVLIQRALEAADNNRTKAAEMLGISVRTLRNKLNGPGDPETKNDFAEPEEEQA